MSDVLFFQGDGQCAVPAGNGRQPIAFTGRILLVSADDTDLIDHVAAAGFEQIQDTDPRYALAVEKGNLFRSTVRAAGLE